MADADSSKGRSRGPGPAVWFVVLGLSAAGFLLVAFNDDDSKWTSLGAQLSAATAVGAVLAIFGQHVTHQFQEEQKQNRAVEARQPLGVRQIDPGVEARPRPESTPRPPESAAAAPDKGSELQLAIEVESWGTDTSRVDADQLRLRTFADGEYFQFFTVVVPGPLFRVAVHRPGRFTLQQFQHAVLEVALLEIRRAVNDGAVPLDDPISAYELFPDLDEAARLAPGQPDSPLPSDPIPLP